MKAEVLDECGVTQALYGLGLSHGITSEVTFTRFANEMFLETSPEEKAKSKFARMLKVADALAMKGQGHNKFLETMCVWIDVKAPRYWWQEMDTYRVGVTKQSESTMHTLTKRPVDSSMFEEPMAPYMFNGINAMIKELGNDGGPILSQIKAALPEGFLQKRIICTNYKALQGMYWQRKNHRLPHWPLFFDQVLKGLNYPRWIHGNTTGSEA